MSIDTSARVALITGAAGGLGQSFVAEFSRQGWRVAAGFHRSPPRQDLPEVMPVKLDVTRRTDCMDAVQSVMERWGRLDLLINNAGITADGLLVQLGDEEWERVLDVHLKGAFLCAQAAVRPMLKQRGGQIINIASWAARTGRAGQSNYAAAKAGMIGLTTSLAREVGSRNVRVNALVPGVLPTGMTAGLSPSQLQELEKENCLGRSTTLEEVARFAVFLASTEHISGQVFQLDSRIGRWS